MQYFINCEASHAQMKNTEATYNMILIKAEGSDGFLPWSIEIYRKLTIKHHCLHWCLCLNRWANSKGCLVIIIVIISTQS